MTIRKFCVHVLGFEDPDTGSVTINIDDSNLIYDLKDAIWRTISNAPELHGILPRNLRLYKAPEVGIVFSDPALEERGRIFIKELVQMAREGNGTADIQNSVGISVAFDANFWASLPGLAQVHAFVKIPPGNVNKPFSPSPPKPLSEKPLSRHGNVNKPFSHSPPKPLRDGTRRKETVTNLYIRLKAVKFIQVRGTPASGKTSLASLLASHVAAEGVKVHWIPSWRDPQASSSPANAKPPRLGDTVAPGWEMDDGSVLIFDSAQTTYWDGPLWDLTFKEVAQNPQSRNTFVIIFCRYGSPFSAMAGGIPWDVPMTNRISLHAGNPTGVYAPAGLYFTDDEFEEYISRREMLESHKFDGEFLIWVFELTAGHVGAFEDIFRSLTALDSYRKAQVFTYSDWEDVDLEYLSAKLEGNCIFSRGMPHTSHLQDPKTANVFNQVLVRGSIIVSRRDNHPTDDAIELCFRQGWLHAVATEDDQTEYIFSTPLHRWFVQWRLFGIKKPVPAPLPYANILDFAVRVIAQFSSTHLSEERMIKPGSTQKTPEAQFQQEFYRCTFDISKGRLLTFPEFGTALGRTDFYIPSNKWGIEVIRNGNTLLEHVSRFDKSGKYGSTLDLADHILLDFRFSTPIHPHPALKKLYHVVFSYTAELGLEALWKFHILDNELRFIEEGILLTAHDAA